MTCEPTAPRRLPLLSAVGRPPGIPGTDDLLPLFARQLEENARAVDSRSPARTGPV